MRFRIEFSAEAERDFALSFDQLFESYRSFGTRVEAALDHCEDRISEIRAGTDRLGAAPYRGQLGHLPVEVSRHDAFTEQLEPPHLRLDQTSSVVSAPAPPDGTAKAAGGADSLIPCLRAWRVFSHGEAFLRAGMTAQALRAAIAVCQPGVI